MKTRITFLKITTITTTIIILILITNNSAAPWVRQEQSTVAPNAGFETNVRTDRDFLSSLTTGMAVPGLYDLSFRVYRNGVLEPVSSLPVGGGPLVLFAHVEDTNGNPAKSGTVTFEYCGDFEPKENCEAGLARWNRLNRMNIGSCYCKSCGGLPNFDPGPGNACLFVFGTGSVPGDDGFRFNYAGGKGGVEAGMSGAANFTWTDAP